MSASDMLSRPLMVSPFIMSRREFVSCRPGITSIMLPIMILSGWSPIPAFTSSTTASAVAALHSIVTIMSLSLSAVHAQRAAKRMAPESAEAAPSAQEPPKNMESAKEMTTYITNCRLCGVPFALRISAISRSSSESSSGAAHIRRERAFIFST